MKKLLIVVDYQNDFVNGSLGFKEAEDIAINIKNKICEYLSNGDDLIYTLDTHEDNYLDSFEGKNLPIVHCIDSTIGHKIYPLCDYSNKAIKVFKKNTFPSLELANYLKDFNYEVVELCGLVSNICVLSNAIMVKSALPNALIIVDALTTASFNKELQEKAFDCLEGLQIEVVNRKKL